MISIQFQTEFYKRIQSQHFSDEVCPLLIDWYLLATQGDIKYYAPNDKGHGGIIAVSDIDQLATTTVFSCKEDIDIENFAMIVVHNKVLMTKKEREE